MVENIYIIIPSLDPDEKLLSTYEGLWEVGFRHFIMVDDGSSQENLKNFPSDKEGVILLKHNENKGKGAALKTAFKYIIVNEIQAEGVITVDSDGQHAPEDVLACAKAIEGKKNTVVLGCRNFSLPDVPKRSRIGNHFTSFVFKTLCGMKISDTQTGLRAFPRDMLPSLLEISGERFEYETNMLLNFKQYHVSIVEVPIKTVYIEKNTTSHFRPLIDSFRIYRFILGFLLSSIGSCLVDLILFFVFNLIFRNFVASSAALIATILARAISSLVNYSINKNGVFKYKQKGDKTLLRYYMLAIPQMLVSAGLVTLLSFLLSSSSLADTIIKAIVDSVLFLISYRIQQTWVFASKKPIQNKTNAKLSLKSILKRTFLSVFTLLFASIITVYSAGLILLRGPSNTIRDMLVLSAKQASATKWLPSLFLSKATVNQIVENSEKINTNTVMAAEYTKPTESGEWDNTSDSGVQLIFLNKTNFKAYVMLVRDPKRVIVGTSVDNFDNAAEGKRIFDLVDRYHPLGCINAGEFIDNGGQGNGATPMGLTYSQGKLMWNDGLNRTFIGFDKKDHLICRDSMTEEEADALGIRDAVSFQNGNVLIEQKDNEIQFYNSDKNTGASQRTAIGQRADGTVILLVTDGRCADSIGATRNDVISIMTEYGAVNAAMLDGGSSAMMYYKDYAKKFNIDESNLDEFQQQGLVNRYKAFVKPRRIPTYFVVTEANQ